MPEPIDINYVIGAPPNEVVRHFTEKGYAISDNWWEVWQQAHTKAFTVAKAARMDVLSTIQNEMARSLAKGATRYDFIRALEPRLRNLGWWGKQMLVDKDGNAQPVQLGSHRRLETIYNVNTRIAYASANYQTMIGATKTHPYWQYISMNDGRVRPSHQALHGKVFRWDDPFWDSHFPPNGWNCRCRIVPLTAAQVKERGLNIESSKGKLLPTTEEIGINPKTGKPVAGNNVIYIDNTGLGRAVRVKPDAGWGYNPGKAHPNFDWQGKVPPAIQDLFQQQKTWQDYGLTKIAQTPAALYLPRPDMRPKARNINNAHAQLAADLGVKQKPTRIIQTPDSLDNVVITYDGIKHIVDARLAARERFSGFILPTLKDPLEVWLHFDPDRGVYRRRFISLFEGSKGKQSLVIIDENKDGSFLFNLIPSRQSYIDNNRKGLLLWKKNWEVS